MPSFAVLRNLLSSNESDFSSVPLSLKSNVNILSTWRGLIISLTWVFTAKWHVLLSDVVLTSWATIRLQSMSPATSMVLSSWLVRSTTPIIPHPRAVFLAYGSSSFPRITLCGLIARAQLAPMRRPTSMSLSSGIRWLAISFRWGHFLAVSGIGIWLLLAGMTFLVYVLGRGISIVSLMPRTERPVIFLLVMVFWARTVESSKWISGPSTPSVSRVDSLMKHASDCSSRSAYTLILFSGLFWWWSQTGTINEWDVQWSKPFIWQTSIRLETDASLFELLLSCFTLGASSFVGVFHVSSCKAEGCGPLHVLQAFFLRQSLFTCPHFRHPQHRRLARTKSLLSFSGKRRNLSQFSRSWEALQ